MGRIGCFVGVSVSAKRKIIISLAFVGTVNGTRPLEGAKGKMVEMGKIK